MRNFKKLLIWQNGIKIADNSLCIVDSLPNTIKWTIGGQIIRASVSIASNIAEGSSRRSAKEKYRFIEIATGSAFELQTQLIIAQKRGLGPVQVLSETLKLLDVECRMLTAFGNKLLGEHQV